MRHHPLIAFALVLGLSAAAFAGYANKGTGNNANSNNNNNGGAKPAQPPPPPVDHTASTDARKHVNETNAEVTKATLAVTDIVTGLRREAEKTPEWMQAQAALNTARSENEAARTAVIDSLKPNAAYTQAVRAKAKAEADRDALAKEPGTTAEQRDQNATALFQATQAVAKIESDAVTADPRATATRAKLDAADRKYADLVRAVDAAARNDPAWQAANKTLDEKKQAATDARKALADAVTKEAEAERDRQKQIAKGK